MELTSPSLGANVTSRVPCAEITNTCPGVYMGFIRHIKIKALKRYKDILQIQIKYNKTHTVILHRPHAHLFTIHSFIHSFIHITPLMHHPCITHSSHTASYHASPIHHTACQRIIPCITHSSHCISTHHTMHHPFITLHLNTSYHASPIHHTASQHIIPVKQYIQQITLTHNALDASQR